MFVTLAEAKRQLNILPEDTIDDIYINDLILVCEEAVSNYLNFSLSTYTAETLPKTIKHGILLLIGTFYANRESVSFAQGYKIPDTLELLLNPIRNYNI